MLFLVGFFFNLFSFVFLPFGLFFFSVCLTPCGPAGRRSGPTGPRVAREGDWRGERGWDAAAPSSCQTPAVGKAIPGREIFISKQPKNREQGFWSPRSPHYGSRGWGVLNPNCFCSRTDIRADGPMDAFLMPTTSVRFQQLRFNATTLQNGVSPLIFYSFRIWAHDFSENHPHSLIN